MKPVFVNLLFSPKMNEVLFISISSSNCWPISCSISCFPFFSTNLQCFMSVKYNFSRYDYRLKTFFMTAVLFIAKRSQVMTCSVVVTTKVWVKEANEFSSRGKWKMSLHEKARRRLKFVTNSVLIIAMNGPESDAGLKLLHSNFAICL